jgi:hypothetical protein
MPESATTSATFESATYKSATMCPISAAGDSPLGKRLSDNMRVGDTPTSPLKKTASPAAMRALRQSSASPSKLKPATGAAKPSGGIDAEMGSKMAEAVDAILTKAYETERQLREAEEDEKQPGVMGRVAAATKRRARRQSKELEEEFQKMMSAELERVFHHFDKDGSGALDEEELKAAFEAAGRPSDDDTIQKAIKTLDQNSDGQIDIEEFKAIAWKCAAPF